MPDPLDLLLDWIAIESTSGAEGDYAEALERHLRDLGFETRRQAVEGERFNVLARAGEPELVFCTHLDTVPPWFGPSREHGLVRGRGACDAKGPALAMIEAARRLLSAGEDRIGFLFTVGEETDSAGARAADRAGPEPWTPRWTIVGEPTENRFVRAHKGIFKARLAAHGVPGHSSQDVGPSAVHELVHCIGRLLAASWGAHPLLGPGSLNVGEIHGGVAANVVAGEAHAEIMVRTVEPPSAVEARVRAALGEHVQLEGLAKSYGPVEFHTPDGSADVVAFATDAAHLTRFGEKLLYGPGRILDAHTDHECLSVASFERAVADYARTASGLLST